MSPPHSPDQDTLHTPDQDTLDQFAHDLREQRLQAGNPTLVALAAKAGVSKSVIAEAFKGRRLPTQNTVGALVDALGADRQEWLARRHALDPKTDDPARAAEPVSAPRQSGTQVTVRTLLLVTAAVAVVCIAGTSAVWNVIRPAAGESSTTPNATSTTTYIPFADGVDPMQTECREDAVIAASEERLDGAVLVQMMYSNTCMAAWGRVTRYDNEAAGDSISMLIYPAIDMESSRNQERTAHDVQSIYTPLMIEPDVNARVCGIATITKDNEEITPGPPTCI